MLLLGQVLTIDIVLWTLDLGLGFGTWIWDLDLGLGFETGLGLDVLLLDQVLTIDI